jgi:hypothetical protein
MSIARSDQKPALKGFPTRQSLPTRESLPLFLSVNQAAWLRGECKTVVYGHIKARRLRTIKRGRARRVVTESVFELNEAELEAERNADLQAANPTARATAARMAKRAAAKAAAEAASTNRFSPAPSAGGTTPT